jgi:phospholipase/carboxylesterase
LSEKAAGAAFLLWGFAMPELLDAIEIETGESPAASIIWLHGLGADGHDFEAIVPELDLPGIPIRFVFPNAPMQPVTINAGMVMRAWYDVSDAAIRREDEAGVRASQTLLEALIAREKQRGSASDRIVLAGFSQGGAIALQTGLRHPERLAGIMALSCYLPIAGKLAAEAQPANRDVPIFMGHGSADPVVALARAVESRELLLRSGYGVEWHDYPMPHSVCLEEIRDISAWLRRVLV